MLMREQTIRHTYKYKFPKWHLKTTKGSSSIRVIWFICRFHELISLFQASPKEDTSSKTINSKHFNLRRLTRKLIDFFRNQLILSLHDGITPQFGPAVARCNLTLTLNATYARKYFNSDHPIKTLKFKKASSTQGCSRTVPQSSTDRALRRLTSEFGRDPVYSARYGR